VSDINAAKAEGKSSENVKLIKQCYTHTHTNQAHMKCLWSTKQKKIKHCFSEEFSVEHVYLWEWVQEPRLIYICCVPNVGIIQEMHSERMGMVHIIAHPIWLIVSFRSLIAI